MYLLVCQLSWLVQVRVPKTLEFKPFAEALRNPGEFEMTDFGKFDRPPLWHLAYLAVAKFEVSYLYCTLRLKILKYAWFEGKSKCNSSNSL